MSRMRLVTAGLALAVVVAGSSWSLVSAVPLRTETRYRTVPARSTAPDVALPAPAPAPPARLESTPVTEPAHIAIPELKFERPPSSETLADGSLSCLNHREVRAIVRCVKCQKVFCEDCVHVLRLAGGRTRVFCPSCSGPCEPLPGTPLPTAPLKPKKQSLFGRLTQTIRIRLK